jgi:hypothetical protein
MDTPDSSTTFNVSVYVAFEKKAAPSGWNIPLEGCQPRLWRLFLYSHMLLCDTYSSS